MSAPTTEVAVISAVTLDHQWPLLDRLILVTVCAVVGALMNSFFLSCFFVEDALKRIGFIFLACVGMADMIVNGGVLPVAAVILISDEWKGRGICLILHFMVESSTYCYSIFFALAATETYYRICKTNEQYEAFMEMPLSCVIMLVVTVAFITAGAGVYLQFDYDYCFREHQGDIYFRIATDVVFHVIPGIYTLVCFIIAGVSMCRRAKRQAQYRRSQQYENDRSCNYLNITAYLMYATAWMPYLFIVYRDPAPPDTRFYYSAWIGVFRSVLTSLVYGIFERNFRRGFAYVINYCCFKSTVNGRFSGRHRRPYVYTPPATEVRVHVMQQISSPKRASSSTRETQNL